MSAWFHAPAPSWGTSAAASSHVARRNAALSCGGQIEIYVERLDDRA